MFNNNKDCGCEMNDVQNKLLSVMFEKQLQASQNNLESAKLWQKTAKFFFFGMFFAFLLSIVLLTGYFYFYDFSYEVVEEEETIVYETNQDTGDYANQTEQNVTITGVQ